MAVAQNPETSTREIVVPVTGMTCASCVRRVERALTKVEGVEGASVNLAIEKATVVYDPGRADLATMHAAIERAGYGVRTQFRVPNLELREEGGSDSGLTTRNPQLATGS